MPCERTVVVPTISDDRDTSCRRPVCPCPRVKLGTSPRLSYNLHVVHGDIAHNDRWIGSLTHGPGRGRIGKEQLTISALPRIVVVTVGSGNRRLSIEADRQTEPDSAISGTGGSGHGPDQYQSAPNGIAGGRPRSHRIRPILISVIDL